MGYVAIAVVFLLLWIWRVKHFHWLTGEWKGDKKTASQWPIWRRWGNLEIQTVAASEYTVWETIAPAASVTGYLIEPSASKPPAAQRRPAKDLRDLPGYWPLP